jgi:hypothetical protein
MTRETATMLARWQPHAACGEPLEITREMMQLALGIAGWTLFSKDLTGEAQAVAEVWEVVRDYLMRRTLSVVKWPESLLLPRYRRYRAALREVDRIRCTKPWPPLGTRYSRKMPPAGSSIAAMR